MKVVVSTIMKDEPPEFIERWAKSAVYADELVLVDTGSTNDAIECARDLGIIVHKVYIKPFRFDTARNAALALLPEDTDFVVKVDVDEVLAPGWRDVLEDAPPADRYSYNYIWNHHPDGTPNVAFMADHTISRWNWQWRHPVHEALYWVGEGNPVTVPLGFTIEHLADDTKSRSQYLPLLARAVAEDPTNDRMAHYYARELYFHNQWVAAREEFVRHLSLPTARWTAERAQSYRYLAKMDSYPERWLLKAIAEDPERRESWVALAEWYREQGWGQIAVIGALRALMIDTRTGDYMSEASVWDDEYLRGMIRIANAVEDLDGPA